MSSMPVDSDSNDDDDLYINAAARLKALKKSQRHGEKENKYLNVSIDENASIVNSEKDSSPINAIPETHEPFCNNSIETFVCDTNLDDDDCILNKAKSPNSTENNLYDSDDDINDIDAIQVTVRWRSRIVKRIELLMDETFLKIFQYFATLEKVSQSQILLLKEDIPIQTTDTPRSVGLSIIDVLEGGIVNVDAMPALQRHAINNGTLDSTGCKIKIQLSGKQSLTFQMKLDDDFSQLADYCAEKLYVSLSQMKFYCDGEQIQKNDTPRDLDFDDEACIDLKIVS